MKFFSAAGEARAASVSQEVLTRREDLRMPQRRQPVEEGLLKGEQAKEVWPKAPQRSREETTLFEEVVRPPPDAE